MISRPRGEVKEGNEAARQLQVGNDKEISVIRT